MTTLLAVRAIIIHNGKLFVVRHKKSDFFALPGGKLQEGESMQEALLRELKEELDIDAKIGPLLYMNEFRYPSGVYSLEFFFLIENSEDVHVAAKGEYAQKEIEEALWVSTLRERRFEPAFFIEEFETLKQEIPDHIHYYHRV